MVAAKMADLKLGANQYTEGAPIGAPKTQAQAAALLNVGRGSIQRARQVVTKAIPEIQDMVTSGEVSQPEAASFRGGGVFMGSLRAVGISSNS